VYDGFNVKCFRQRRDNFKNYIIIQTSRKETAMDRLVQDYIVCSYLWNGRTRDSLILMAYLSSTLQKNPIKGIDGNEIEYGVIEHWQNEVDGLKLILMD
jgi:hypothetical protein